MFWENFCSLCQRHGVAPTQAAIEMGFSRASVTKWKNGAIPSADSLHTVSKYFNVSATTFLQTAM